VSFLGLVLVPDPEPNGIPRIPLYEGTSSVVAECELVHEAELEILNDPNESYEVRVVLAEELGLPAPPYPLSGATDCVVEEIYEC
jgi:hypothetical protein